MAPTASAFHLVPLEEGRAGSTYAERRFYGQAASMLWIPAFAGMTKKSGHSHLPVIPAEAGIQSGGIGKQD